MDYSHRHTCTGYLSYRRRTLVGDIKTTAKVRTDLCSVFYPEEGHPLHEAGDNNALH